VSETTMTVQVINVHNIAY